MPRKLLRQPTPEELLNDAAFRRWRYHAPASLKWLAYEVIERLAREPKPVESWTDRAA